jgi:chloramphenicol 3-O-phosphotransferase
VPCSRSRDSSYVRAGFTAVVQDVIVGPVLADVIAISTARPLHVVVLNPEPEIVAEREARRSKAGYGQDWSPRALVDALRGTTPRLGLWLDTTDQTPADTVRTILERLAESAVGDSRASQGLHPRP